MILVFGHQKQVGKDTAAMAIRDLGRETVNHSLAGPLYAICQMMLSEFKSKYEYDKDPHLKSEPIFNGKTPRDLLIETGEKLKEIYGKDCWVKLALSYAFEGEDLIISDMRYKEEAEVLKQHGAIFVKIVRPDLPHTSDKADDDLLDWDGWDHTLINMGAKEELERAAQSLYLSLKGEKGD